MLGYLYKGEVSGACEGFSIDPEKRAVVAAQADLSNLTDETLIVHSGQLFTIYEANGINVNWDPVVHRFNLSLDLLGTLTMPKIEYRITDATEVDDQAEFWAINYFSPGDAQLVPGSDQISIDFGLGISHRGTDQVERLIALRIGEDGISIIDQPPIEIKTMFQTIEII